MPDVKLLEYLGGGAFAFAVLILTFNFILKLKSFSKNNMNGLDKIDRVLIQLAELQSKMVATLEELKTYSIRANDKMEVMTGFIKEIQYKINNINSPNN